MTSLSISPRFPIVASAVFFLLSAAIVIGAYTYQEQTRKVVEDAALSELTTITEMKVDEMRHWHSERLSDARSLSRNTHFALGMVKLVRQPHDSSLRLLATDWMQSEYRNGNYRRIALISPDGKLVCVVPDSPFVPAEHLSGRDRGYLPSDSVRIIDLNEDDGAPQHLDIVVPLFANSGNGKVSHGATLIMVIDPEEGLFRLLRRWPLPAKTSGCSFFRIQGDTLNYPGMDDRLTSRMEPVPAIGIRTRDSLSRGGGIAIESDAQGHHFLICVKRVPETPWFLDARIDADDIYRSVRNQGFLLGSTSALLILGGWAAIALVWRRRLEAHRNARNREDVEHEAVLRHLALITRCASDAIFWYGAEGKILFVNSAVSSMTGYALNELLLCSVRDLQRPFADSDRGARDLYLRSHESVRYDTSLRRKDGSLVPVEMMETHLSYGGKEYCCAVARDLSERKRAEEQIRRVNRMYAILSKVNDAVGRIGEPVELYREVCRIAVREGEMAAAAVFQRDAETGGLRPVAWSGVDEAYFRRMTTAAGDADGSGPVTEVWKTGILAVQSDIVALPGAADWRAEVVASGFRSLGCFPVKNRNSIAAVVALYSAVPDHFSGEEKQLLSDLAVDVSFGIEFIEAERERRTSADILRMSEFTYRVLFDNNPRPMFVFDPETLRFLAVNSTAVREYGYSHDEFLNMSLRDIQPADDLRRLEQHVARPAAPHGSMGITRHRKKNGDLIDVEIFRHDFEFAGRPAKLVVVSDITEQEELLVKLEGLLDDRDRILERLQFQFEIMPLGCVVVDEQLTVVDWNPAASAIFGYSKEEMVGQQKLDRLLPAEARRTAGPFPGVLASLKELTRIDVECAAKNGERRFCEWIVSPLQNAQGQTIGVLAMVRDISVERRAEQEIRKLNEELEARVVLRTRQLENANRELEAFSYSISHDLRAPLRGIEGFTRILEEDHGGALPEAGQRFLSLIRANATKMNHLIDDLLGFSRVGRQALNAVPIDMTAMVREVVNSLPAGLQHLVTVKPLPPAQGDPPLLRQVWFNLLSNGLKFSARAPSPSVVVESVTLEDEPVYLVRDNGAGFDMRYADKLFGVFQRLHSSAEFDGTGVGLAIVHRVIQRHGGRVWAHGEPGKGATFYFTVPPGSMEGGV